MTHQDRVDPHRRDTDPTIDRITRQIAEMHIELGYATDRCKWRMQEEDGSRYGYRKIDVVQALADEARTHMMKAEGLLLDLGRFLDGEGPPEGPEEWAAYLEEVKP